MMKKNNRRFTKKTMEITPVTSSASTLIPVRIDQAIDEFLTEKRRTKSPHTVLDYALTMRRFREYLGDNRWLAEIDKKTIRAFLGTIPGSHKNQLNAMIAVSALWTYCLGEQYVAEHIVREIEKSEVDKREIHPFTREEVMRMAMVHTRNPERDLAIQLVLLDTGIRADELCNLKSSDIRGETFYVFGKGAKEREVPFSPTVSRALLDYLAVPRRGPGKFIFQTENGSQMNPDRLLKLIRSIGERAGVEGAHPHRFRHTFAINYLMNGGDAYTLQRILGHSTMEMVRRYLEISKRQMMFMHHRASPVENWHMASRKVVCPEGANFSHP